MHDTRSYHFSLKSCFIRYGVKKGHLIRIVRQSRLITYETFLMRIIMMNVNFFHEDKHSGLDYNDLDDSNGGFSPKIVEMIRRA